MAQLPLRPDSLEQSRLRGLPRQLQSRRHQLHRFSQLHGRRRRYATYVEPMVRISDRGIVPQAMLDNSLGCRWAHCRSGSRSLRSARSGRSTYRAAPKPSAATAP
ncbi:MAG: hypothetical protein ACLRM8_02820 [Alistipes sp.]